MQRQHEGDGRIGPPTASTTRQTAQTATAAADGDRRGEGERADAVEGVERLVGERRVAVVLAGPRRDRDEHVRETWWLDGVRHPRTSAADDEKPNAAAASGTRRWAHCCP